MSRGNKAKRDGARQLVFSSSLGMQTVHTPGHTPVYTKHMGERDKGREGGREGRSEEKERGKKWKVGGRVRNPGEIL